jgi:hypothetical protein
MTRAADYYSGCRFPREDADDAPGDGVVGVPPPPPPQLADSPAARLMSSITINRQNTCCRGDALAVVIIGC